MSTLFASFLGYNPIGRLLRPYGVLGKLAPRDAAALTSKEFFPTLISGPFHHGLVIVFSAAIAMSLAGALVSLTRGRQFIYAEPGAAEAGARAASSTRPVPAPAGGTRDGGGGGTGERR